MTERMVNSSEKAGTNCWKWGNLKPSFAAAANVCGIGPGSLWQPRAPSSNYCKLTLCNSIL